MVAAGWRFIVPRASRRVAVLCYHSVHPTISFASATPALFEQHLAWLVEECEIVPFRHVLDAASRRSGGRPAVALTFDDGYADNYEYVFPVLQRYGVPATFFLTVGFVERDPGVVARFSALRRSGREDVRPLDWSQVREMRRAGMEMGAHTYSHPNLARLDRAAVEDELRRSKTILEDRLGARVTLMAYPFGKPWRHFTPETMEIAARIGYEYGAAVVFRGVCGSRPRLAIPRFFVPRDSVATVRDKVLGAWDLVGAWQETAPVFLQELAWRTP